MLIELDVAVAHALAILVCHLGHGLSRLVHEVVVDEPLAHKLLRELLLGLALLKFLLVAVGIEIAAAVGGVDLIDKVDLAVVLSKLILGVDQYQTVLGSDLLSALE